MSGQYSTVTRPAHYAAPSPQYDLHVKGSNPTACPYWALDVA